MKSLETKIKNLIKNNQTFYRILCYYENKSLELLCCINESIQAGNIETAIIQSSSLSTTLLDLRRHIEAFLYEENIIPSIENIKKIIETIEGE